jgi:hypothetical protein
MNFLKTKLSKLSEGKTKESRFSNKTGKKGFQGFFSMGKGSSVNREVIGYQSSVIKNPTNSPLRKGRDQLIEPFREQNSPSSSSPFREGGLRGFLSDKNSTAISQQSTKKSLKRFLLVTSDRLLMTIKKLFNFFTRRSFSEGGILSKLARFCFNTKTRSAISLVLMISLLTTGGFLLYKNQQSSAQYTYETNQSDWSGGEDTSSTATISTMDGWSKYYSKSPFITTGSSVSALNPVQQIVDTSDTDFGEGTLNNVEITGSGEGASLELGGLGWETLQVTAGQYHTCAIMNDNSVKCWGQNSQGQLGNNSTIQSLTPVSVSDISTATQIAPGISHTCALLNDNSVKCWGDGGYGQLGNNSTIDSLTPVSVSDISTAIQITSGYYHTCALLSDNSVKCWGRGSHGQLGNDSTNNSKIPVSVAGISTATQIASSDYQTCALLNDNSVKCWGNNAYGQLGNNSTINSSVPVSVAGISTATQITVGGNHACALLDDNSIKCWGWNNYGQIGDDTEDNNRLTPVSVSGISDATQVMAGGRHTCAILSDNSVKCWGGGGMLGNDSAGQSLTPVSVSGISTATQITAG